MRVCCADSVTHSDHPARHVPECSERPRTSVKRLGTYPWWVTRSAHGPGAPGVPFLARPSLTRSVPAAASRGPTPLRSGTRERSLADLHFAGETTEERHLGMDSP